MVLASKGHRMHDTRSDRVFNIISTTLLVLVLLVSVYPLYFVLIASVSDVNAVNAGKVVLWPEGFHLDSYIRVFQNQRVLLGYRNTVIYTVLGTLLNLALTLTAGYALSLEFPGRRVAMFFITFTMYFSGGLIPTYFLYKDLHLLNTVWVMIIPGAVSAYNLIIARTFFHTNIPKELYEVAELDGCSRTRFFFSVVLPLSQVLTAILGLFYAVGHWNSYFDALMFLNERKLHPLQLVLREILIQNSVPVDDKMIDPDVAEQLRQIKELMKYSLIVVSSLPVLIAYPFLQKYFVKGIMIGSIKG